MVLHEKKARSKRYPTETMKETDNVDDIASTPAPAES